MEIDYKQIKCFGIRNNNTNQIYISSQATKNVYDHFNFEINYSKFWENISIFVTERFLQDFS